MRASVHVLLRRRRRRLLLVQLLDLGEERAHLGGLAALARDRADVTLAVDQELGVGRAGEEAVRRDDLGGAVGDHREQDARRGPEMLQASGAASVGTAMTSAPSVRSMS